MSVKGKGIQYGQNQIYTILCKGLTEDGVLGSCTGGVEHQIELFANPSNWLTQFAFSLRNVNPIEPEGDRYCTSNIVFASPDTIWSLV